MITVASDYHPQLGRPDLQYKKSKVTGNRFQELLDAEIEKLKGENKDEFVRVNRGSTPATEYARG